MHNASSLNIRGILRDRFGLVPAFVILFLALESITRLGLTLYAAGNVSWNLSLVGSFLVGFVYDLGSALLWSLPLILALAFLPKRFFSWRPGRWLVQLLLFGFLFWLLFISVSEFFFWQEFGSRFNFIAVDYLVYTTEVVGNIAESYPLPLILGSIGIAALVVQVLLNRSGYLRAWADNSEMPFGRRMGTGAVLFLVALSPAFLLNEGYIPMFHNNFNRELAKNGPWSFVAAFRANELDYATYYPTIDPDEALSRVKECLTGSRNTYLNPDQADLLRKIEAPQPGPEKRLNVIQITVESLSAEFIGHYGNTEGLTPFLDSLAAKSLVFENFYATGNRTDRGMEALSLSLPPTPGRSLIKRPVNADLFTLGSVFRTRDYETAFLYSGYGYFDNMNAFFGNNGYRVVDRASVAEEDVTFANVWGACDEDLYRWTLREADRDYAAGKPFFYFVMTTSNHRPFTYPDGKIDLPSKVSGRAGAVKYTDYAIGQLIRQASTRPWFEDTVFVIVADHCAESAGRTELPVQNYHIPIFIYAPGGQIEPGSVDQLCSQIDYAPTLLGLLNWDYESRFFGRDVLHDTTSEKGRSLIGTYQRIGLFDGNELAVLEPVKEEMTFKYDPATDDLIEEPDDEELIHRTIAYYETASILLENGNQKALKSSSQVQ